VASIHPQGASSYCNCKLTRAGVEDLLYTHRPGTAPFPGMESSHRPEGL
jgi:hypothetical protein